MQREKASAPLWCVDAVWTVETAPVFVALVAAAPALGEAPHAAASIARQATAPIAIRAVVVSACRGRRLTRMLRVISSSSGWVDRAVRHPHNRSCAGPEGGAVFS
jgi:hypothetical protein